MRRKRVLSLDTSKCNDSLDSFDPTVRTKERQHRVGYNCVQKSLKRNAWNLNKYLYHASAISLKSTDNLMFAGAFTVLTGNGRLLGEYSSGEGSALSPAPAGMLWFHDGKSSPKTAALLRHPPPPSPPSAFLTFPTVNVGRRAAKLPESGRGKGEVPFYSTWRRLIVK